MYRLIYKSRANQRIDWDFVNGVIGASEQNNEEDGITGVFDFNRDLIDDLIDQYGEEDGSVRFPVEEWKVLALISDLRRG